MRLRAASASCARDFLRLRLCQRRDALLGSTHVGEERRVRVRRLLREEARPVERTHRQHSASRCTRSQQRR